MPISVDCPQCSQHYSVKESHSGRKFRCKTCGHVVTVPSNGGSGGSSDDPWEDLDLDLEDGAAVEEQTTVRPLAGQRFRSEKSTKQRHRDAERGQILGLPIPVAVAIGCEGMLVLVNILNTVGSMMSQNPGGACGASVRIVVELLVILGLIQGVGVARMASIVLSAIGIALLTVCAAFLFTGGQAMPQVDVDFPIGLMAMMMILIGGQIALMVAIIVCLMTQSAVEYFD